MSWIKDFFKGNKGKKPEEPVVNKGVVGDRVRKPRGQETKTDAQAQRGAGEAKISSDKIATLSASAQQRARDMQARQEADASPEVIGQAESEAEKIERLLSARERIVRENKEELADRPEVALEAKLQAELYIRKREEEEERKRNADPIGDEFKSVHEETKSDGSTISTIEDRVVNDEEAPDEASLGKRLDSVSEELQSQKPASTASVTGPTVTPAYSETQPDKDTPKTHVMSEKEWEQMQKDTWGNADEPPKPRGNTPGRG